MAMKQRIRKIVLLSAALLLVGCIYAWVCSRLGGGIPCVFHLITGLQCPGCGVSRMCMALLRLDFAGAWQANPAILCMLPLGTALAADVAVGYVRTGAVRPSPWANWVMWSMIAALVVFGLVRNLL